MAYNVNGLVFLLDDGSVIRMNDGVYEIIQLKQDIIDAINEPDELAMRFDIAELQDELNHDAAIFQLSQDVKKCFPIKQEGKNG